MIGWDLRELFKIPHDFRTNEVWIIFGGIVA